VTRLAKLRRLGRYSVFALLSFLLLLSAALWYVTTDSFQEMVRRRLTASIERATGGRVELGSFHVVPLRFQVEVRNLTIHGREAPNEVPLVHVDSMSAIVDLTSVLGAKMAFHSLVLDHPVVHVVFYPDGTTNKPTPRSTSGASFDRLFSISVRRLEVHRGELLWQDKRIPLEFVCNDLKSRLDYSFLHQRYSGDVSVGRGETHFDGYLPVAWTAETDFSVSKEEIQIRSLSATSANSRLEVGGIVSGFQNPRFKGSYHVQLDLRQAAKAMRDSRVDSGTLQLQGMITVSQDTASTSGNFDLRDASWRDQLFTTRNISASGKFMADPEKIAFSGVQGRVLRGSFSSEAELSGWRNAKTRRKEVKQIPQRGSVSIKAKDISLGELIAGLGAQFHAIQSLKLAGNLAASSDIQWKDSIRNAEMTADIAVTPPSRPARGQLPLTANARFRYRSHPAGFEVSDSSLHTPATQVLASGSLPGSNSVKLSVTTSDLTEWQPLIATVYPDGVPVAVNGRASFVGNVGGSIDSPVFAGNLQMRDFDTSALQKLAAVKPVHWDSMTTGVQLSSGNLTLHNGHLQRGNTSVNLAGSVGLSVWRTSPDGPVRLRIDALNADASDVARLAGRDLALAGTLNAHLEVSGTVSKPQGKATISWLKGSVEGHAFDSASASVEITGGGLSVRNLEINRGPALISGSGSYQFVSHAVRLDVNGANFALSEFSPLERSRIKIGGTLDFSATASGTVEKPDVNAHLQLRKITFNDETAGDFKIDAITHGADMRLTGRSEFGNADLQIQGDVRLREQWPAHIDFHFARLDADPFLETYLHGHITGHSAVTGDLVLQGPLRDPRQLSLSGNLSDLHADIEKVQIRNDGPVRFSLTDQTLAIQSLRILGEDTDFSATGSAQLSGERTLDLHGTGRVGVQLVHSYDPDLNGSGTVNGEVRVEGNLSAPIVRGSLQIQSAAISDINLPSALSELNGTLQFNQNQITIEKLVGRTGGGTVSFTGHAQLRGKQIFFDVAANADSVRLRYPPGVSSTATANLRWNGSSSGSLLSGDITITKIGVTPEFDFSSYLQRAIASSGLPQTDPVLNNIHLDLHVVTAPELQMQTSVLRLRGDADLHVRGSAAKPVLLGRADVFEGEAYFNGTKYRLERGGVSFGATAGSAGGTVPFVDLQATTHVRDYDITLSVTGPADRPKMNYRSEPPLPTNDIIGLLAFGQTSEESAQLQQTSQAAFSQQASNAMLAAALNATLNNRTQRLFGNSRIKIDPQGLTTETSPTQSGPAVTIEQQVKDNLTITYTTNVAQTTQQIIRAEYYVSRTISIVAIRDQNGVISFDVKIRRRKR
jgi:translocation and assembly module TamB